MGDNGTATIKVELQFNLALLEYASQIILERYNLDVSMFTAQELVDAWTKAVQHRLEIWAEDTDHFLASNGSEERFFQVLLDERDALRGRGACSPSHFVV